VDDLQKLLASYSKYSISVTPEGFLSGDIGKREGKIELHGKKSDDLNGAVRRRFVAELNRYFWLHPKDVDDTRLVFEASEIDSKYEEAKGKAKLVLKLKIELAENKPEGCCCC
jgi:hypothetical protein